MNYLKRIDADGKPMKDLDKLSLRNRNLDHNLSGGKASPAGTPNSRQTSQSPSAPRRDGPPQPTGKRSTGIFCWLVLVAIAVALVAIFWGYSRNSGESMGVAVLESKFRELTASHEKLSSRQVESLDKATKAAVAPRSKLDAGLTDLSKRVETLKLAVAKAAEEQVKVKEEGAATGKELSSLKAQVTDADKARLGANAAREKAVDAALEAIRAKLAKAEKGVAALSGKDTAAQAAAAKEEVLKAAGVAIAAKMEAHAKTLHQAGNATTQQV
ncbi:hypothetical protein T484DRAFT_1770089 [Baffinella frigidus]|nr:hypothetical protein T484DRAFT_1770089 [Cryptophyta sp. CCMP2293]